MSSEPESLLERAAAGDRTAFREVYARHRTDVARLVFRMVGSAEARRKTSFKRSSFRCSAA